jgi:cold shock protein
MSRMQNRIDVQAEINACERIRAFDERRLNLELSKVGVDPEGLSQRIDGDLGITALEAAQPPVLTGSACDPHSPAAHTTATSVAALLAFELAGNVKFFDAARGFGFFVADGDNADKGRDVLVHVLHLQSAGYRTIHEGARVHAMVLRTPKGLQVSRILSIDESSAIHPSQLPQRTREKVQPESPWVRAEVKWYNREKGYGFVCEGKGSPDAMVHADTLRRWGVAPLCPKQVVEVRWGMSSKGRMVAEIRCLKGLPTLPLVH